MVDYLCRYQVLVPSGQRNRGRGRSRRYSFGDLVMLRAMTHLLECGISIKKLKVGLVAFQKRHGEITPKSLPGKFIVAVPSRLVFQADQKGALEELNGQMAFGFILKIEEIRNEVVRELQARGLSK
jgi:DNA-binding transcriptional MerR regulator